MIHTRGLSKCYTNDGVETTALSGVDIDIKSGELVAVTGPSGCGKSTLLNLLGLIDTPDTGDYFFDGKQVAGLNERQRASVRKQNIGFIFQNFNLVPELSVYENIELPLLYTRMKHSDRKARVTELMEQMKLTHRKDYYPRQLSGGQQQRVAVARALSNSPRLILADEPTGNLDSKSGNDVMQLLLQLNEYGSTVVIVTHEPYYAEMCRRTITLLDGQIVTEKKKQEFHV